jgi:anti-sigma factor RsiW
MNGHIDDARLVALGLGEVPSTDEAQHLAGCPTCAASPAADTELWASLRQVAQPLPPPDFAAQALVSFRRARRVRHRPREVVMGSLVVLALVVVLCAWGLRLVPGALVSLAVSLPRWSELIPATSNWGRLLGAALPTLGLCALVLLAGVAVLLRRLTAAAK